MKKRRGDLATVVVAVFAAILMAGGTCFSLTIKDSVKLYKKGYREYKRADYEDAIGYFKKSINECPESAMTRVSMYYLGKSYEKSGNKKMALTTFEGLVKKYKTGEWVNWAEKDIKKMQ